MDRMNSSPARSLLTERWMSAAIVIVTLLFLSVNWYYYARTRSALDEEFSVRLGALASLAASAVDPSRIETHSPELTGFDPGSRDASALDSLASRFDLASIQVLREDGIVLLTTRPDICPPG